MADQKISARTAAGALTGAEIVPVIQSALDRRTTTQAIANLAVSGISQVKVSLSSAEILALFTTPKTLVAAQGAGKFINVLSVVMRLNYGTTPYATNTTLSVAIGSWGPIVTTNSFFLASTSTDFNAVAPVQSLEVVGAPDWVNAALVIKCLTGNPTAGDSTMDVYVTYNVITL